VEEVKFVNYMFAEMERRIHRHRNRNLNYFAMAEMPAAVVRLVLLRDREEVLEVGNCQLGIQGHQSDQYMIVQDLEVFLNRSGTVY